MKKYLRNYEDWVNESDSRSRNISISLDRETSESIFFESLANALDYMTGYGLKLKWNSEEYDQAKETLSEIYLSNGETVSFEDILMKVLKDGGSLTFEDIEYDGEYTSTITIQDVWDKVQNTPYRNLISMIEENGDASDSDAVLQTVFFGEILFG